MNGVIQGGWEFVIAAYTITAVGFLAYTIRVIIRLRELKKS